MVEKRKLPARAAARVEQIAKKRNITPPSSKRSDSPAPPPEPTPDPKSTPVEEAPILPKSISAGKPLPTVETAQPDDLSSKDYQSVAESGVLAESITRSRQRWLSEGIFEKYWSKPIKKKGVIQEEPNNPPKDSMVKLGQVTITVEPHVFEATMFAVKDPKPVPPPQTTFRPVIQYGPPNGVIPPPPTPKAAPSTKLATPVPTPSQPQTPAQVKAEISPSAAQTPTHTPTQASARVPTQPHVTQPTYGQTSSLPPTPTFASTAPRPPVASPRGMESVLEPNSVVPQPPQKPSVTAQNTTSLQTRPSPSIGAPAAGNGNGNTGGLSAPTMTPMRPAGPTAPGPTGPKPSMPGAPAAVPAKPVPAPGADPIILTLAEKAGEDPHLRDLMKKVAQGDAAKHELERFQAIIDAITAESKRGPSADKLVVDGRTVRYFADEVRAILDIVLRSNPKETSAHLLPPAGTDPLVVMLVKAALDDAKTKEIVRRIADKVPRFSDATDLKAILDRLCDTLAKDKERKQTQLPPPSPATATAAATTKSNGMPNGQASSSSSLQSATAPHPPAAQQALRSKGPPPPPKPDISAVVFEFVGGTGDRYMFPKFSVLETLPVPAPQQQVVASFLIVRRGSQSEYPLADPALDYYQPVTIRLFTSTGRHLENLARVVAPQEEVRRYMDDVMEKMHRAEYVLLATRLPRDKDGESSSEEGDKSLAFTNGGPTTKQAAQGEQAAQVQAQAQAPVLQAPQPPPPTVMWATRPPKPEIREVTRSKIYKPMDVDDQYQSFISTVKKKETKEV